MPAAVQAENLLPCSRGHAMPVFSSSIKLKSRYMYRLHHEVEVSMGFTHRGPEARGCVNRVETEPSDVTDLYHGLRGPDNVSTA